MKIKRYVILRDNESEELEALVQERLAQGYQLQGGVSITARVDREGCERVLFAQAMTYEAERQFDSPGSGYNPLPKVG